MRTEQKLCFQCYFPFLFSTVTNIDRPFVSRMNLIIFNAKPSLFCCILSTISYLLQRPNKTQNTADGKCSPRPAERKHSEPQPNENNRNYFASKSYILTLLYIASFGFYLIMMIFNFCCF